MAPLMMGTTRVKMQGVAADDVKNCTGDRRGIGKPEMGSMKTF